MNKELQVMDMIDKIEEILDEAPSLFMSQDMCKVDRHELKRKLELLRSVLPEEISQAVWINKERAKILKDAEMERAEIINKARHMEQVTMENAKKESDRIVAETKATMDKLDNEHKAYLEDFYRRSEHILEAKKRAKDILDKANIDAGEQVRSTKLYVDDIFDTLEGRIEEMLRQIRKDRSQL